MPKITTPAEYQAALAALEHFEGNKARAAKALGMPVETFKSRINRAGALGLCGTDPVIPGFEVSKVTTDPKGGQYITQRHEHGEVFEVPPTHFLGKITVNRDADGRVIQDWVRAMPDDAAREAAMRAAVEALKEKLPRVAPTKGPKQTAAHLLNQFTVTDLHFGMLAWSEETGGADYDLKIAEGLLLDWFAAAIAMSPNATVAVLAQLGDLMHHDALESVTPLHRNILDADSRLQKIIRVVIRVLRQVIAMLLEKHERVHVIMASANHDPASSAWLRELLHAMYEKEKRITIDNSPDIYYAYEWGKTALFYHHGHKRKLESVDTVFAGKFRELYGRSEHSYGHIGHIHNDALRESNLMRIERHRTLAPPDAYASGGGWLAKRDAKVITYHRDFGEVSRITLSPQMVQHA